MTPEETDAHKHALSIRMVDLLEQLARQEITKQDVLVIVSECEAAAIDKYQYDMLNQGIRQLIHKIDLRHTTGG